MNKLMILLALLLSFSIGAFAQNTKARERAKYEVNQIEKYLNMYHPNLKLQESQKIKLEYLIAERENKKIILANAKLNKNEFAQQAAEINREYIPAIKSILEKNQLDALARTKKFQYSDFALKN